MSIITSAVSELAKLPSNGHAYGSAETVENDRLIVTPTQSTELSAANEQAPAPLGQLLKLDSPRQVSQTPVLSAYSLCVD
jgi:hypothetical protein